MFNTIKDTIIFPILRFAAIKPFGGGRMFLRVENNLYFSYDDGTNTKMVRVSVDDFNRSGLEKVDELSDAYIDTFPAGYYKPFISVTSSTPEEQGVQWLITYNTMTFTITVINVDQEGVITTVEGSGVRPQTDNSYFSLINSTRFAGHEDGDIVYFTPPFTGTRAEKLDEILNGTRLLLEADSAIAFISGGYNYSINRNEFYVDSQIYSLRTLCVEDSATGDLILGERSSSAFTPIETVADNQQLQSSYIKFVDDDGQIHVYGINSPTMKGYNVTTGDTDEVTIAWYFSSTNGVIHGLVQGEYIYLWLSNTDSILSAQVFNIVRVTIANFLDTSLREAGVLSYRYLESLFPFSRNQNTETRGSILQMYGSTSGIMNRANSTGAFYITDVRYPAITAQTHFYTDSDVTSVSYRKVVYDGFVYMALVYQEENELARVSVDDYIATRADNPEIIATSTDIVDVLCNVGNYIFTSDVDGLVLFSVDGNGDVTEEGSRTLAGLAQIIQVNADTLYYVYESGVDTYEIAWLDFDLSGNPVDDFLTGALTTLISLTETSSINRIIEMSTGEAILEDVGTQYFLNFSGVAGNIDLITLDATGRIASATDPVTVLNTAIYDRSLFGAVAFKDKAGDLHVYTAGRDTTSSAPYKLYGINTNTKAVDELYWSNSQNSSISTTSRAHSVFVYQLGIYLYVISAYREPAYDSYKTFRRVLIEDFLNATRTNVGGINVDLTEYLPVNLFYGVGGLGLELKPNVYDTGFFNAGGDGGVILDNSKFVEEKAKENLSVIYDSYDLGASGTIVTNIVQHKGKLYTIIRLGALDYRLAVAEKPQGDSQISWTQVAGSGSVAISAQNLWAIGNFLIASPSASASIYVIEVDEEGGLVAFDEKLDTVAPNSLRALRLLGGQLFFASSTNGGGTAVTYLEYDGTKASVLDNPTVEIYRTLNDGAEESLFLSPSFQDIATDPDTGMLILCEQVTEGTVRRVDFLRGVPDDGVITSFERISFATLDSTTDSVFFSELKDSNNHYLLITQQDKSYATDNVNEVKWTKKQVGNRRSSTDAGQIGGKILFNGDIWGVTRRSSDSQDWAVVRDPISIFFGDDQSVNYNAEYLYSVVDHESISNTPLDIPSYLQIIGDTLGIIGRRTSILNGTPITMRLQFDRARDEFNTAKTPTNRSIDPKEGTLTGLNSGVKVSDETITAEVVEIDNTGDGSDYRHDQQGLIYHKGFFYTWVNVGETDLVRNLASLPYRDFVSQKFDNFNIKANVDDKNFFRMFMLDRFIFYLLSGGIIGLQEVDTETGEFIGDPQEREVDEIADLSDFQFCLFDPEENFLYVYALVSNPNSTVVYSLAYDGSADSILTGELYNIGLPRETQSYTVKNDIKGNRQGDYYSYRIRGRSYIPYILRNRFSYLIQVSMGKVVGLNESHVTNTLSTQDAHGILSYKGRDYFILDRVRTEGYSDYTAIDGLGVSPAVLFKFEPPADLTGSFLDSFTFVQRGDWIYLSTDSSSDGFRLYRIRTQDFFDESLRDYTTEPNVIPNTLLEEVAHISSIRAVTTHPTIFGEDQEMLVYETTATTGTFSVIVVTFGEASNTVSTVRYADGQETFSAPLDSSDTFSYAWADGTKLISVREVSEEGDNNILSVFTVGADPSFRELPVTGAIEVVKAFQYGATLNNLLLYVRHGSNLSDNSFVFSEDNLATFSREDIEFLPSQDFSAVFDVSLDDTTSPSNFTLITNTGVFSITTGALIPAVDYNEVRSRGTRTLVVGADSTILSRVGNASYLTLRTDGTKGALSALGVADDDTAVALGEEGLRFDIDASDTIVETTLGSNDVSCFDTLADKSVSTYADAGNIFSSTVDWASFTPTDQGLIGGRISEMYLAGGNIYSFVGGIDEVKRSSDGNQTFEDLVGVEGTVLGFGTDQRSNPRHWIVTQRATEIVCYEVRGLDLVVNERDAVTDTGYCATWYDDDLYVGASAGTIYYRRNLDPISTGLIGNITAICSDETQVILGTDDGVVAIGDNGGFTSVALPSEIVPADEFLDADAVDGLIALVTTDKLVYSTDDGATWQAKDDFSIENILGVYVSGDTRIAVYGGTTGMAEIEATSNLSDWVTSVISDDLNTIVSAKPLGALGIGIDSSGEVFSVQNFVLDSFALPDTRPVLQWQVATSNKKPRFEWSTRDTSNVAGDVELVNCNSSEAMITTSDGDVYELLGDVFLLKESYPTGITAFDLVESGDRYVAVGASVYRNETLTATAPASVNLIYGKRDVLIFLAGDSAYAVNVTGEVFQKIVLPFTEDPVAVHVTDKGVSFIASNTKIARSVNGGAYELVYESLENLVISGIASTSYSIVAVGNVGGEARVLRSLDEGGAFEDVTNGLVIPDAVVDIISVGSYYYFTAGSLMSSRDQFVSVLVEFDGGGDVDINAVYIDSTSNDILFTDIQGNRVWGT